MYVLMEKYWTYHYIPTLKNTYAIPVSAWRILVMVGRITIVFHLNTLYVFSNVALHFSVCLFSFHDKMFRVPAKTVGKPETHMNVLALSVCQLTCVMLNKCETWAVTSDSPEQPQPRSIIFVGGSRRYSNII